MTPKSVFGRKPAAWVLGLLWLLLLWPVAGYASHRGPVFYVDANNPPEDDLDGDYHFHSLTGALTQFPHPGEDDTLLLAPGVYPESIVLAVEGLTLKASGPSGQTVIEGQVEIAAKRVRVERVTVNAGRFPTGIHVRADKATVEGVFVFGAQVGIFLKGSGPLKDVRLLHNRVYHNGVGIQGEAVRHLWLEGNTVEANAQAGGMLSQVYDLTLSENTWRTNAGPGLTIFGAEKVSLTRETLGNNSGPGGVFDGVDRMTALSVVSSENGGVGLQFSDVQQVVVQSASVRFNAGSGLVLEAHSQGNRIEGGVFEGHGKPGTAGVWLRGGVCDNQILNNSLKENQVGVRLSAADGAPGGNRFENNEIVDSNEEGVRVEASEGDNTFARNTISGNNGTGVLLAGRRDRLQGNVIKNSGGAGVWLDGAFNVELSANEVVFNQGAGVRLSQAAQNTLQGNLLGNNHQDGVTLSDSPENRLQDNLITFNNRHGISVENSDAVRLTGNRFDRNGELGVWVRGGDGVDIRWNEIVANRLGGVVIEGARRVELEANAIENNLFVGLRVEGAQVWARRNWWGDPLGPAGLFEGRGNAVVGVLPESVVPWLPDQPRTQDLSSSRAALLEAVGPGERLWFDWRDRAGVALELSELGRDDLGNRAPISLGVLLLSRYAPQAELDVPLLLNTLTLYSIQKAGFSQGQVQLEVSYDALPSEVDPDTLRLWWWDGDAWVGLPGIVRPAPQQVTGELAIALLTPALIALAPDPEVAARAQATTAGDLSLIGASLILVGLGRALGRRWKPDLF